MASGRDWGEAEGGPSGVKPYVNKVSWEHGQMLVEEFDAATIDTLGDVLADLMGASSVDHVERSPSVLSLRTGRSTTEQ